MICDKCGSKIESKKDPWCMYKVENGKVISRLFHPDAIPKGWADSPQAAKSLLNKPVKAKKITLNQAKASFNHGNSSRSNQ